MFEAKHDDDKNPLICDGLLDNSIKAKGNENDDKTKKKVGTYDVLATVIRVFICFVIASIVLHYGVKIAFLNYNGEHRSYLTAENAKTCASQIETIEWKRFCKFQAKFSKSYKNALEEQRRFNIFQETLREIRHKNSNSTIAIFGITQFADMAEEELRKLLMPVEEARSRLKPTENLSTSFWATRRPKRVDWRREGVVTPVKNQLQCGACWAFAAVGAVESQFALHTKKNRSQTHLAVSLSAQQLLDCDLENNACSGGDRYRAFSYVRREGLVEDAVYSYEARRNACKLSTLTLSERIKVNSVYALGRDEEQIAQWLATNGPVTFGMNVTREMFIYKSGVFSPSRDDCAHKSLGSHAMEVVGYDVARDGTPYWILKNSWGAAYGVNGGYLHMRRGVDACGLARNVLTPLIIPLK